MRDGGSRDAWCPFRRLRDHDLALPHIRSLLATEGHAVIIDVIDPGTWTSRDWHVQEAFRDALDSYRNRSRGHTAAADVLRLRLHPCLARPALVGEDEGELSAPITDDKTITLHWDRDQAVDPHALRGILDQPRTTAWSGITPLLAGGCRLRRCPGG
jgi:hypothetical protein